ncbi:MAG: hypothetical protein Kow0042_01750 [Calditrichia bacterium]
MKKDLVCGMMVDEKSPPERFDYKNQTYLFCSEDCKSKFVQNPEKFIMQVREAGNKSEDSVQ